MGAFFSIFRVAEDSMAPALQPGDRLVVRSRRRGRGRPVRRGAVVAYRAGDDYLVKRVIGRSGERIAIAGGVISINGRAWTDPWWGAATRPDGEWLIPPDSCFVLGDNRPRSAGDSRTAGPVSAADIAGVAVLRYRPRAKVVVIGRRI